MDAPSREYILGENTENKFSLDREITTFFFLLTYTF